jgi:death on curing protein
MAMNTRVALVVMVAFLERNGVELTATNEQVVSIMFALAAGDAAEGALVDWIEAHSRAI